MLIVDANDNYNDTFKMVKECSNREKVKESVLGIRCTRAGKNLVLPTQKDADIVNRLHEALRKKWENIKVMKRKHKAEKTVAVHIRGLDAQATKEEVKYSIGSVLDSTNVDKLKINKLRPNINNKQALTVISGPTYFKRKILVEMVHSAIIYAVPVWCKALRIGTYKILLTSHQRKMLIRVFMAYRMVPAVAVQVLAAALQDRNAVRTEKRHRSVQDEWNIEQKGEWEGEEGRMLGQV